MSYKILFTVSILLFIAIILEPWFILALEPSTIYLFNILASLSFIIIIVLLIKKIKNERAKKEIISLAAHQLSAPLASIKWSLQMLLNNDFGKITEEQRQVISGASKKNNQLIYLVEDLLNASKIENGKYFLEPGEYQIENIVSSIIDFYKEDIKKKRINFKFDKPGEQLPKINIDGGKIRLAVQNLFDNSIKYTPVGGEISVSLRRQGKNIEFKIQDSGIGIEKNQKKEIFNKFFRGTNAMKEEPMGYGLGLYFVKNIVESHKGRIWFKSEKNKGSSFYFTLPIAS